MLKQVIVFVLIVVVLLPVAYFSHDFYSEQKGIVLSYSLLGVYAFFAIAAVVTYGVCVFVMDMAKDKVGFAFIGMITVKLGFFLLLFSNVIFGDVKLEQPERIAFVIPLLIFLMIETLGVYRLLVKN